MRSERRCGDPKGEHVLAGEAVSLMKMSLAAHSDLHGFRRTMQCFRPIGKFETVRHTCCWLRSFERRTERSDDQRPQGLTLLFL
jgi:hypothetical protein